MTRIALFISALMLWTSTALAQPVTTVVLTFDIYASTPNVAFPIMQAKGLVGSYYNNPLWVGTTADYATKAQLVTMKAAGWEIGLYVIGSSGENMETLYAATGGAVAVNDLVKSGIDSMWALGFKVTTIAPAQRRWSTAMRNLAQHGVKGVRILDSICWYTPPIPDPLYFRCMGSDLDALGGSHTFARIKTMIDSIPAGEIGVLPHHAVGPVGDPYTLTTAVFDQETTYLQSLVAAGTHRVVTFDQVLRP